MTYETPTPKGQRTPRRTHTDEDLMRLAETIPAYFETCNQRGVASTMAGLRNHLGMKKTLFADSQARCKPFAEAIAEAKEIIVQRVEELLLSGKATVGCIFWLKNQAGWVDAKEREGGGMIQVVINPDLFTSRGQTPAIEAGASAPPMLTLMLPAGNGEERGESSEG